MEVLNSHHIIHRDMKPEVGLCLIPFHSCGFSLKFLLLFPKHTYRSKVIDTFKGRFLSTENISYNLW